MSGTSLDGVDLAFASFSYNKSWKYQLDVCQTIPYNKESKVYKNEINRIKTNMNTFLENKMYPNFIKMDIEGHEVKVFEGGLDYFSKNPGKTKILLEVHPHFYSEENLLKTKLVNV